MMPWRCAGCDTFNNQQDRSCHICGEPRAEAVKTARPAGTPAPAASRQPPPSFRAVPRPRRRPVWIAVIGGVALAGGTGAAVFANTTGDPSRPPTVAVATGAVPQPMGTAGNEPTDAPLTSSPPVTASSAPPLSTTVGVVDYSPVASDADAPAVATVLDTYFSGINDKDFARATSVFDPAGAINPNNSQQVAKLAHDDQTSTIGNVVINGLGPDPSGQGTLVARTAFRSTQSAGFGPHRDPNETCTQWTVTYTFVGSVTDGYRILKGSGPSSPC